MQTHRAQDGYSLLEALVAIMLTSMVILGLAGSLLAAIKSSEVADRVQRADSALGSFTESLKTMPYPDTLTDASCATSPGLADFQAAWNAYADRWIPPSGTSIAITEVEHWQPDGTDMGTYTEDCPTLNGSPHDPYTHRLTVEVEIKDRSRSAQVVVAQR